MPIKKRPNGSPTIARTYRLDPELYEFIRNYAFDRNMTNDLAMEKILITFRENHLDEDIQELFSPISIF